MDHLSIRQHRWIEEMGSGKNFVCARIFTLALALAPGLGFSTPAGAENAAAAAPSTEQTAAERGDPKAQYHLGYIYLEGKGVTQDDAQALLWFQKAAEQGFAQAQYVLGFLYQEGRGTPKDDAQAALWFRKAAEQGDAEAQYVLGFLTWGILSQGGKYKRHFLSTGTRF